MADYMLLNDQYTHLSDQVGKCELIFYLSIYIF